MIKRLAVFSVMVGFTASLLGGPVDREVEGILNEYFKIQRVLAQDTTRGVDEAAKVIVRLSSDLPAEGDVARIVADIRAAATRLPGKDLAAARSEFFALSKPLLEYLHQHYAGDTPYFRYYCSMARKGWVQDDEGVRNPYHGSEMLTCGERIG